MALTFKNLFDLNITYIDYLLKKSLFSHQYINNIAQTGSEIEGEIRELFKNLLPQRYKVTHGYIVHAPEKDAEPLLSPQVDVIIVDTLVPHSLFIVDKTNGLEIVPKEAVVGIFEIKRTLNNESLTSAVAHLKKIINACSLSKFDTSKYLPGGIYLEAGNSIEFTGGYNNNPLVGIISLDHDDNLHKDHPQNIRNKNAEIANGFVDIITSLKGFTMTVSDGQGKLRIANPRIVGERIDYVVIDIGQQHTQARVLGAALGYIMHYIQLTVGLIAPLDKYYFNDTLNVDRTT